MLTTDTHTIDYVDTGDGPAIVFVPGSFSTPAAWRGIQKRLPQRYRFVGTSLCGYGETAETRSPDDLGIEHQIKVIEAVAQRIGAPVHLVGHSFGGTIALASALAGTIQVLSITTFEANPLLLLRERGHTELFTEMQGMSAAFEAAWNAGEHDAAGRIIDFWGGAGSFGALPEPVREYCRSTAYANVLDWRTAYTLEAKMADYATLGMPVLLVRGGLANPAMVEITQTLSDSLPNVRTEVVDDASHFLITTHVDDCARLLADFLATVER